MAKFIDRTGSRYGKLIVQSRGPNHCWPNSRATPTWNCLCECGAHVCVLAIHLTSGRSKSCGCLNHALRIERSTKHGMYGTPEYRTWQSMHQRCSNQENEAYPEYGGRGIFVCKKWKDFEAFYADMGSRPNGTTIDRIDNDVGYEPGNCRWETKTTQVRNRRCSITVELDGKNVSLTEAAELTGLTYGALQTRWMRGKRGSDLFKPLQPRPQKSR